MASTGSSRPTMRPTSRAHRPPQLTTCSQSIAPRSSPLAVSYTSTRQPPSRLRSMARAQVLRYTSAPAARAALA